MDDITVFPEMKTALRTYHPVPSLQKTDGNAQDAPRIKNCLKAALLPSELRTMPPTTPEEILQKLVLSFSSLPPLFLIIIRNRVNDHLRASSISFSYWPITLL